MEIWKDIEGYEGIYQVSNIGRVRTSRFRPSVIDLEDGYKIMRQQLMTVGYYRVTLSLNGVYNYQCIHRLVWEAFGDKQERGIRNHVDHINNNKKDNRIENLQLIPARINATKDRVRKELTFPGIAKSGSRFRAIIEVNKVAIGLGNFDTQEEAFAEYERAKNELFENGYVTITQRVYDTNLKKCIHCNTVKFKEDFYVNATKKGFRLRGMCIACDRIIRKAQRDAKKQFEKLDHMFIDTLTLPLQAAQVD